MIGIVTGAQRDEPAMWEALAECDLAEFRADTFGGADGADAPSLSRAFRDFLAERDRRGLACSTLMTIRLARDGGAWADERAMDRLPVLDALGCAGSTAAAAEPDRSRPDWLDLEIEEYPRLPAPFRDRLAGAGTRLLLSHHDFRGCPPRERLRELLRGMLSYRPAAVKFAVTPRSREELIGLLAFAREAAAASPRACVLAMGETGRALRVLGPALGCPLAYGFLTGRAVAPGQLSAAALRRHLDRFSAELPGDLLAPGAESRLLDWAEARLQGDAP